jgi:hypothetical protein
MLITTPGPDSTTAVAAQVNQRVATPTAPPAKRVAWILQASCAPLTYATAVAYTVQHCPIHLIRAHHRPMPGGRLSRWPDHISSMRTTAVVDAGRRLVSTRSAESVRERRPCHRAHSGPIINGGRSVADAARPLRWPCEQQLRSRQPNPTISRRWARRSGGSATAVAVPMLGEGASGRLPKFPPRGIVRG